MTSLLDPANPESSLDPLPGESFETYSSRRDAQGAEQAQVDATQAAQTAAQAQQAQTTATKALGAQGYATYPTTNGSLAAIADPTTLQPLKGDGSPGGIVYGADGNPQRVTYSAPDTPSLVDPYKPEGGGSQQTDDAGNVYDTSPGLPWKYNSTDPDAAAQAQADQQAKNDAARAKALDYEHQVSTQQLGAIQQQLNGHAATLKANTKALSTIPELADANLDGDTPPDLDKTFATTAPSYNETSGFFGGGGLTAAAQQARDDLSARKTQAQTLLAQRQQVQAQQATMQGRLATVQTRLDAVNTVREKLASQRLAATGLPSLDPGQSSSDDTDPTGQNLPSSLAPQQPPAPQDNDDPSEESSASPVVPAASQGVSNAAGSPFPQTASNTPAGQPVPAVTPGAPTKPTPVQPFAPTDPPFKVDADTGQLTIDPSRLSTGLIAANKAGLVDDDTLKKILPQALDAEKAAAAQQGTVNELQAKEASAGNYAPVKAAAFGAAKAGGFLAASAPGAAIGAEIGAFGGPLAWATVPAGSIIGGLITGTLGSMAVDKTARALAEHSDTIKSFTDASDLHPYYDAAGNLLAFGAGLPKVATSGLATGADALAGRAASVAGDGTGILSDAANTAARVLKGTSQGYANSGGLADTISNLSRDAANRVASGATAGQAATALAARVAGKAGAAVAIDAIVKEGSKALGYGDEGETLPGAVQAALIGAFTAGHGLGQEGYGPQEVANIVTRAKLRQNAGLAPDEGRLTPDQIPPNVDNLSQAAYSKPLTAKELEVLDRFGQAVNQLKASGKLAQIPTGSDLANVARRSTATQSTENGQPYGVTSLKVAPDSFPEPSPSGRPSPALPAPESAQETPAVPSPAPVSPAPTSADAVSGSPQTLVVPPAPESRSPSPSSISPAPASQAQPAQKPDDDDEIPGLGPNGSGVTPVGQMPQDSSLADLIRARDGTQAQLDRGNVAPEAVDATRQMVALLSQRIAEAQSLPVSSPAPDQQSPAHSQDPAPQVGQQPPGAPAVPAQPLPASPQAESSPSDLAPISSPDPAAPTAQSQPPAPTEPVTPVGKRAAALVDGYQNLLSDGKTLNPAQQDLYVRSQAALAQDLASQPVASTPAAPESGDSPAPAPFKRGDSVVINGHPAIIHGITADGLRAGLLMPGYPQTIPANVSDLQRPPAPTPTHENSTAATGQTQEIQQRGPGSLAGTASGGNGPAAQPATTGVPGPGGRPGAGLAARADAAGDGRAAGTGEAPGSGATAPEKVSQRPVEPLTSETNGKEQAQLPATAAAKPLSSPTQETQPGRSEGAGQPGPVEPERVLPGAASGEGSGPATGSEVTRTVEAWHEAHVARTGWKAPLVKARGLPGGGLGYDQQGNQYFYDPAHIAREMQVVEDKGGDGRAWLQSALKHEEAHQLDTIAAQEGAGLIVAGGNVLRALDHPARLALRNTYQMASLPARLKPLAYAAEYMRMLWERRNGLPLTESHYRDTKAMERILDRPQPQVIERQLAAMKGVAAQASRATDRQSVPSPSAPVPTTSVPTETVPQVNKEVRSSSDQTPAAPERQTKAPRSFKMPEADNGAPDALDHIRTEGGIVSPAQAKLKPTYSKLQGDYDGAPTLGGYYQHAVYRGGKQMPDQMAQTLHENYGIGDGSVDGMWNAVKSAVDLRRKMSVQRESQATQAKQAGRFDKDALTAGTAKGKTEVNTSNLSVGDKVQVGNQTLKVIGIDPDTLDVELEDHSRYGVQKVADNTALYVEKVEPVKQDESPDNDLPTLRNGEKQGDLLSKQSEDLRLVGEKGIDHDALQKAQEQADRDAAEAKAKQDREQLDFTKPEPPVKAVAPLANTDDAGAELTYNRRNRTRGGIKWDDIANLNPTLRVKETNKANVFPKPDYEKLMADGVPKLGAHLVKQVYDSIASKPVVRSSGAVNDDTLQRYISGVHRVMDATLKWAKNPDALGAWAKEQNSPRAAISIIGQMAKSPGKSLLDAVYPDEWRNHREELLTIGGNKVLAALQPGYKAIGRATKDSEAGWPSKQESWQKQGIKIIPSADFQMREISRHYKGDRVPGYTLSGKVGGQEITTGRFYDTKAEADAFKNSLQPFLVFNKANTLKSQHATQEEAEGAAREMVKRESGSTVNEKGISAEQARREGPAHRMEGEDISTSRLQEQFGFKGVNFGNWMKGDSHQAERQLHLNHAYDSFMDLADILGVPPQAMSLNGMLGLAVGAQGGGGRASAHFVPGVNEINLTRTAGAGAVAHEWAHALDHYFGTQAGVATAASPYLSEHLINADSRGMKERVKGDGPAFQGIRPVIVGEFKKIVDAMNHRPQTPEEQAAKHGRQIKETDVQVGRWLEAIRRDFEAAKVPASALDAAEAKIKALDLGDGKIAMGSFSISPAVDELRSLFKAQTGRAYSLNQIRGLQANLDRAAYLRSSAEQDANSEPQQVRTTFAQNADKLDGGKNKKPYWSTNREKFARAFDAFTSDTLAEKAQKNTYLAGLNKDPETSPMGAERDAIKTAFKSLVDAIEHKETDAGIALYAASPSASLTARQQLARKNIARLEELATKRVLHPVQQEMLDRERGILRATSGSILSAGSPSDSTPFDSNANLPESHERGNRPEEDRGASESGRRDSPQAQADIARRGGPADQGSRPFGPATATEAVRQASVLVAAARESGQFIPPAQIPRFGPVIEQGHENQVRLPPGGERVVKITKGGRGGYGLMPYLRGKNIGLRPGTPAEYFDRLALQNQLFGDDIRYEGITRDGRGEARIVTSQPFVRGEAESPTTGEIQQYMADRGFVPISGHEVNGFYRPSDNVAVVDAHEGNFVKTPGGLAPIDVVAMHPDEAFRKVIEAGSGKDAGQRLHWSDTTEIKSGQDILSASSPSESKDEPKTFGKVAEMLRGLRDLATDPERSPVASAIDDVKKVFAPAGRGKDAKSTAEALQQVTAEMDRNRQMAHDTLSGFQKLIAALPEARQKDVLFALDDKTPLGDPALEKALTEFRALDTERAAAMKEKLDALGMTNWKNWENFQRTEIPHIFKQPEQAAHAIEKRFESNKQFLKRRGNIPWRELIQDMGLEPASYNAVDLVAARWMAQERFFGAQKLADMMTEAGSGHFETSDYEPKPGEVEIGHRLLTRVVEKDGQSRKLKFFAQEPAAHIVENYLSQGLRGKAWFRAYMGVANRLNAAQLSLSAFHGGFITIEGVTNELAKGIDHLVHGEFGKALASIARAPVAPILNYKLGKQIVGELRKPGSESEAIQQMVQHYIAGGGRGTMDSIYHENDTQKFLDAFRQKKWVPAALRAPLAAIHQLSRPIMEKYVPYLKAAAAARMISSKIDRNPNMTPSEVRSAAAEAVRSVNNTFGQMTYDNLHLHKTTKDVLMGMTRSLGWNWGTFAELGGGVKDFFREGFNAGRFAYDKARGNKNAVPPEFTAKMAYTLALPFVAGTLGAIINGLFGQKPENLKDLYFPKTGDHDSHGQPLRLSLPTYMKDVFAASDNPTETVTNKLHPFLSMLGQMFQNRDFYGAKIRNEDDPILRQILDELKFTGKQAVPFTIANAGQLHGDHASLPVKALGFVGFGKAPARINQTDAEKLALKFIQERAPAGSRTREQVAASEAKNQAINALRQKDNGPLRAAVANGTIPHSEVPEIVKRAAMTRIQSLVHGLGLAEAEKVFSVASPAEQQQLRPLIALKQANAQKRIALAAR